MPRRPNTKNLPSRLWEETESPIYVVDRAFQIIYANEALGRLLGVDRETLIKYELRYAADLEPTPDTPNLDLLCPPQACWNSSKRNDRTRDFRDQFVVPLMPRSFSAVDHSKVINFNVSCQELTFSEDFSDDLLVCCIAPERSALRYADGLDGLHRRILEFRLRQSEYHQSIPFLGDSPEAKKCFLQAGAYALVEGNVSLVGHPKSQVIEIGKAIHYSGFAAVEEPKPLLPIDCQLVKGDRIEEILIGHCQVNLDQTWDTAHLLLTNVHKMDSAAQSSLLNLMNLQQLRMRVIATSELPLQVVEDFDSELAQRLSTLQLQLPKLSDRRGDVPILAQNILEKSDRHAAGYSESLIQVFQAYHWPGDFGELCEVVEFAHKQADGKQIGLDHCPSSFRTALTALENPIPSNEAIDLDSVLIEVESEAISRALEMCKGNKTGAAKMLGITRARLHRRLNEINNDQREANESDLGD